MMNDLDVQDISSDDVTAKDTDFKSDEIKSESNNSEEVISARKQLIWMRRIVFWVVIGWSLISLIAFGAIIWNNFFCSGNLFKDASIGIFILAGMLAVIPTIMLSFITCSVFRRMDKERDNDSAHTDKAISFLRDLFSIGKSISGGN